MSTGVRELERARADRLPAEQVVRALGSDAAVGLPSQEAQARLAELGRNELPAPPAAPLWKRALRQLRDPMALLLLAAAAVSGLVLRETVEAVAIAAIVCLNAVIALVEEGRAASALAALRGLEVAHARVRRDGADRVVDAAELVPGDLVLLEAGDRVPADLAAAVTADEVVLATTAPAWNSVTIDTMNSALRHYTIPLRLLTGLDT